MFRVVNIKSPRSGRPVANQFKVIMDTTVGRVVLFQSYDTPITMLINSLIHGTVYYITTSKKYSRTTTKYQKMFYEKHGKHLTHQYSVSNFSEWLEAIQVANMTSNQQETLSAYLDVFQEVKDKTVINDIFNGYMFLTSSYDMTDYARNWLADYLSNIVYDAIKNYMDFKSLGAAFYADGCYIKTPKGIIERL